LKAGVTSVGGKAAEATESPALRKSDTGLNTSVLAPSSSATDPAPGKEALKSEASHVDERAAAVGATRPLDRAVEERSSRQRVMAVGSDGTEGKIAPRVEKLRQASSAMLEEASSDPGLRFVLVAIVIFLLSLLLLLLNHLLG
jgi:hypothetical protein